jgi:hypothetical protein
MRVLSLNWDTLLEAAFSRSTQTGGWPRRIVDHKTLNEPEPGATQTPKVVGTRISTIDPMRNREGRLRLTTETDDGDRRLTTLTNDPRLTTDD